MTNNEHVSFFHSSKAAAQYGRREAILNDGRAIQYTIEKRHAKGTEPDKNTGGWDDLVLVDTIPAADIVKYNQYDRFGHKKMPETRLKIRALSLG